MFIERPDTLSITNIPSTPFQRKTAAVISAFLILATAAVSPFAHVKGLGSPAFVVFLLTSVLIMEMITAFLMFSDFFITRKRSILLLASAYLFSGLMMFPQMLAFPGAFSEAGLLHAGTETRAWLWVFWHGGFPVLVLAYGISLVWSGRPDRPDPVRLRTSVILATAAVVALVVLLTWLALESSSLLPTIIEANNAWKLVTSGIGPAVVLLNAAALLLLFLKYRGRSVIILWLTVAMLASLLETTLTLYSISRYSWGWYVARTNSLLSAMFVLATLLYQLRALYYRVINPPPGGA